MSRLLDLVHQVSGRLRWERGGTGNPYGWGTGVVEPHPNWDDGNALPLWTLVRLRNGTMVYPTTAVDEVTSYGVVVGSFTTEGVYSRADVPASGIAAVMTKGQTQCLIEADVDAGDYAFAAATDGTAYGDPTAAAGAFGVWVQNGILTETGTGIVSLFGSVVLGAGGGGGGFSDASVEAEFDLPTGGDEAWTRIPWDMTITGWDIAGDDPTGDAEVDVWVGAYLPTVGDTITASDLPTLVNDDHDTGAASGWTTGLSKGDWMVLHVNSVSGHQRLVVNVYGDRTS